MINKNALPQRTRIAITLGLTTLFSTAAFADTTPMPSGMKFNPAAVQKALAARQALQSGPKSKNSAGGLTRPSEIFVNPYRAYPPSCLNDGLPGFGTAGLPYPSDPDYQQFTVDLPVYDSSTGQYDLTETDQITIWRVPCSNGVSATLLEVDRPTSQDGSFSSYPIFPNISQIQGGTQAYARLPSDPNTVFSDIPAGSNFIYSNVFVLDYYNPTVSLSPTQIDYNQAFTLRVDTLVLDNSGNDIIVTADMPAYNPANFNNYPSITNPMEISGYMSTNWSSSTQGGEGIVMQVYDSRDSATRSIAFAWFTYDDLHLPFWLFGQTSAFPIGANQATAQVAYYTGGAFAGSSSSVPPTVWGTAAFTFPDCNDMTVVYSGDASAVNGPTGSGTKKFVRVANVNGLVCN
jgi:hypothetical protein